MPKARVNGINIFYRARGKGEPLMLIMGLGGEAATGFSRYTPSKSITE